MISVTSEINIWRTKLLKLPCLQRNRGGDGKGLVSPNRYMCLTFRHIFFFARTLHRDSKGQKSKSINPSWSEEDVLE